MKKCSDHDCDSGHKHDHLKQARWKWLPCPVKQGSCSCSLFVTLVSLCPPAFLPLPSFSSLFSLFLPLPFFPFSPSPPSLFLLLSSPPSPPPPFPHFPLSLSSISTHPPVPLPRVRRNRTQEVQMVSEPHPPLQHQSNSFPRDLSLQQGSKHYEVILTGDSYLTHLVTQCHQSQIVYVYMLQERIRIFWQY